MNTVTLYELPHITYDPDHIMDMVKSFGRDKTVEKIVAEFNYQAQKVGDLVDQIIQINTPSEVK